VAGGLDVTQAEPAAGREVGGDDPVVHEPVEDAVLGTGAVNNFRWNESPVDLLRRFSHASATEPSFSREWGDDYFSRTATPALRIPDFNMSSVSQAL
jgi:hypothetical protein